MMVTSIESRKDADPILALPTQKVSTYDVLSSNELEGENIYKRQNNIVNNTEKTTARDP